MFWHITTICRLDSLCSCEDLIIYSLCLVGSNSNTASLQGQGRLWNAHKAAAEQEAMTAELAFKAQIILLLTSKRTTLTADGLPGAESWPERWPIKYNLVGKLWKEKWHLSLFSALKQGTGAAPVQALSQRVLIFESSTKVKCGTIEIQCEEENMLSQTNNPALINV